jgi:hypothetical protein
MNNYDTDGQEPDKNFDQFKKNVSEVYFKKFRNRLYTLKNNSDKSKKQEPDKNFGQLKKNVSEVYFKKFRNRLYWLKNDSTVSEHIFGLPDITGYYTQFYPPMRTSKSMNFIKCRSYYDDK